MERLSLIWKCCEVRVCVFMGEGEGRGNVGEWDCKYSLKLFLFFLCLHHQWMQLLLRWCQTISCLHSCTPVTFSLQENGGPWFYSIFSWCQSLCNTRFVVFSVFFSFFILISQMPLGKVSTSPSLPLCCVCLKLAKLKETSISQFDHHFLVEASIAGVLENITDKQ